MEVLKTVSQFCEQVTATTSSLAKSAGEQLTKAAESLHQAAERVSAAIAPHLETMKIFVTENRGPILVGTFSMIIGAALATAISSMWKGQQNAPPLTNPNNMPNPTT